MSHRHWSITLTASIMGTLLLGSAVSRAGNGFLTGPSSQEPLEITRSYLQANHAALYLTADDVAEWSVSDRYMTAHNGVTHIYLRQTLGGIEVFNGVITANVARDGSLISLGSRFAADLSRTVNTSVPALSAADALQRAAENLGLAAMAAPSVQSLLNGPSMHTIFERGALSRDPIPARLLYLPMSSGAVRLVWDLRIRPDDEHAWQMEVDAVTGEVLQKIDLVKRDSYKVYALPAESPNHVAAPLPLPPADGRVTVSDFAADPTASPFGWHDLNGLLGADTINTTGNNVFAQTDLDMNDAFTPLTDVQPTSLTRSFDYPVDFSNEPTTYLEALVTNLFYWNNVSHDIHYLYGFDEVSGNFQTNTYGRGGLGGDGVQADAQDGSGTNNANFLTLPDGAPPRMQMYAWIAPPSVVVNAPASIAGEYASLAAAFGPTLNPAGVTADLEMVDDGTPDGGQGCGTLTGFTAGRIALIARGTCEFGLKALNAQNAGAVAAIIYNNQGDEAVGMAPGQSGASVTIPVLSMGQSDGESFRATLMTDTVNVTMKKVRPDRDSDFDNAVILHEYGHGVSTRLTGGPQALTCLSNDQQGGEGWSDWWGLALTARASHTAALPRGIGTYLTFQDPPGFGDGIRPFPYSTDLAVNPQTYGDLATGNLPVPHGVGSVWATTLWEMYWAIVNGVPSLGLPGQGFRQNLRDLSEPLAGNQIALQLVMDGLKMQPCNPSFVDARDAILAADQVNNAGVYQCHLWYAFAKRGLGINALDDNGGLDVTPSFFMPQSCTTGACVTPPAFAGAERVVAAASESCQLEVQWSPADNNCGSEAVTYDVYRSTNPKFLPAPARLVASDLTTTSYTDTAVEGGTRYYYIVKAADHLGNVDENLFRRSEAPVGSLTPGGSMLEDAGDTAPVRFTPGPTALNSWSIRPTEGVGGTAVHATTAAGNYADRRCMSLASDTIYLGANPTLTFQTRYDNEATFDGGIVEVATAATGFTHWTKLGSIAYPGLMAGPLSDPSCSNPGLRDGEPAFTGTTGGEYVPISGSLADYANQAVRIRFVFASDGGTNDLGWFIDDIAIDDVQEVGACAVAIAGAGDVIGTLRVNHAPGGDIALSWGPSCAATDDDYAVYEGTLGTFDGHVPRVCTTEGATTFTLTPQTAGSYYLVVPRNLMREGSHGLMSDGTQRSPGPSACVPQEIVATCP